MRALRWSALVKSELIQKAKIVIFWSTFFPRSRIQAGEISYLWWVAGLSLRDGVKSWLMWRELGGEPLLLPIERSQLWWFGIHSGLLPLEVFQIHPSGRPWVRPRTRLRDFICPLAWERLLSN